MATEVNKTVEHELSNGEVIKLRPLNIKALRLTLSKADVMYELMNNPDDKTQDVVDIIVDIVEISLKGLKVAGYTNAKEEVNKDAIEENFDIDDLWVVLEVCAGIKRADTTPN